MSSSAEHAPPPHLAPHVPAKEQVRRQGIQPITSVDELAFPRVWESDEELDDSLADLRLPPRQHAMSLVVLGQLQARAQRRGRPRPHNDT
jgi:hypothetical protein